MLGKSKMLACSTHVHRPARRLTLVARRCLPLPVTQGMCGSPGFPGIQTNGILVVDR